MFANFDYLISYFPVNLQPNEKIGNHFLLFIAVLCGLQAFD